MSTETTIFIVDDDDAIRDSLVALLGTMGMKTQPFSSGTEFLAGFDKEAAGCVLLDIVLGDINGIDLLERLSVNGITLPVIMLTGHGDVPVAVRAMQAGAVDFIEKPYDHDRLVEAIENALIVGSQSRQADAQSDIVNKSLETLTPREREVLEQLVIGHPNKIIAYELGISPRTVEIHRARVMEKMQADSLSHLVRMALGVGLGDTAS